MSTIANLSKLEENLSEPTELVVSTLAKIEGDILVLGAGGKMGPSLARMASRAIAMGGGKQRVLAASRFSDPQSAQQLQDWGIETISGDMLDQHFIAELPDAPNVIYMAGKKFGTDGAESLTWATNAYLPGIVCDRFRGSRIVAFSTGNVYRLMPTDSKGSLETDAPNPHGEYGMSCLGRERVLEYFSRTYDIPMALIRLNYATELRYGVLVDIAQKVFREEPIVLDVGYFNAIWQTDANAMTLCALANVESPPFVLNVTGPGIISCREVAERFGQRMNKPVKFVGTESSLAALSSAEKAFRLYGKPPTSLKTMLDRTADWIQADGVTHGKPTHFEAVDGKY